MKLLLVGCVNSTGRQQGLLMPQTFELQCFFFILSSSFLIHVLACCIKHTQLWRVALMLNKLIKCCFLMTSSGWCVCDCVCVCVCVCARAHALKNCNTWLGLDLSLNAEEWKVALNMHLKYHFYCFLKETRVLKLGRSLKSPNQSTLYIATASPASQGQKNRQIKAGLSCWNKVSQYDQRRVQQATMKVPENNSSYAQGSYRSREEKIQGLQ